MMAAQQVDYHKGQHVGFVELRRLETPLPKRWYVRRCMPGRDGRVIEHARRLDVCAWSPLRVRYVDRQTGKDAIRPHLGRRVASPFLPGLIFIPDFDAGNPEIENLECIETWLEITVAGAAASERPQRRYDIADRHGNAVLPRLAIASLSSIEMAGLREIVDAENAPRAGRGRRGRARFTVGQSIYVADGPFAGFAAKVERLDSRGRLKAFIAALMGGASVDLSETQVEPA